MLRKKLALILYLPLIISVLTGCGSKQDIYESHKSGYKEIMAVDGIKYDLPETALSMATAVTSISDDMDFDSSNVYLYKDGKSQYILFEMDAIVIAVQKGTSFDFINSKDKDSSLKNAKVLNIWFDKESKEWSYIEKKGNSYKLIGTVTAQVSVTDELYNDFVGQLASINNGSDEWSLFIGAPGTKLDDLSKKQISTINHVASSLCISNEKSNEAEASSEIRTEEPEFITEVEVIKDVVEKDTVETEPTTAIEELSSEETTTEETEEEVDSSQEETEIQPIEKVEDEVVINEKEEITESKEEKAGTKDNVPKQEENIKDNFSNQKNKIEVKPQKEIKTKKHTAYESSIYNMLRIGDTGIASVRSDDSIELINFELEQLYTEDDAIKIIKEGLSTEGIVYENPPIGCTWNVIEYSTNSNLYVNIKMKGFDGEKLKYRGISYTPRTFDLFGLRIKDNVHYIKQYCYYAVPNGCKKYMLECGDGTIETNEDGITSAYFNIEL